MRRRLRRIALRPMDLDTFEFLLTPEGRQVLEKADVLVTDEQSHLRALTILRKSHPATAAAAAVETIILRRRAVAKFSRAGEMFFTREALEQSSGEAVSSYRTRRFAQFHRLADLPCGIGGDLINLARLAPTLAVERDPLLLRMAEANAAVYEVRQNIDFRQADLAEMETPDVDAIWFDPSRRVGGRRKLSLADYDPPVSTMLERWTKAVPAIGVKVAPAVSYDEIPTDCEVEFISEHGELKDAVLWFGPLRTVGRRATLLPSEAALTDEPVADIDIKEPGAYLYEPDPAVIRAHLVEHLAARIDSWKLGEDIAYLSSHTLSPTLFARAYQIHEVMPFSLKKLNEALKSLGASRVVIKRRGSPVEPEEIEKKLKLKGDREVTVVLTRSSGRSMAILCQPT